MVTSNEPDEKAVQAQREVQRKLGRCVLLLQQYERLLRGYLAQCAVTVTFDRAGEMRVKQRIDTDGRTLGQMMADFKDKVVGDWYRPEVESIDERQLVLEGHSTFSFSNRVSMDPVRYEETRLTLERLVQMRNELVHHFIEKFDLWSEPGCAAASNYLDECFAAVHSALTRLREFVKSLELSRAKLGEFLLSEEGEAAFAKSMTAGSTEFVWSESIIVSLLMESTCMFAVDGWTPLDQAIDWIAQTHPAEVPKRYRCSSWRQVLHDSKCFDIRRESSTITGGAHRTWYRVKKG